METLADFCKKLKKRELVKKTSSSEPLKYWSEKDVFQKKIVDSFVIIFKTRGCSWALKSGCTMCGYFNDSLRRNVSMSDLMKQLDKAMSEYSNQKIIKIYTSGSFLDEKEIKPLARQNMLKKLFEKAEMVSIETRPEYITIKKLEELKKIVKDKQLEVSIGLETSDDFIRETCINKGFSFSEYKKTVEKIKKFDFKIKTYVIIKPPFLSERKSIEDAIRTVKDIQGFTDSVSFNPTNVQRNTVVEYLWKRGLYRPPWLWSVIRVLVESKKLAPELLLKCDVVAGGKRRGAHNCGKCDQMFLKEIAQFSLRQNIKNLESLKCECEEKWLDQLATEELSFGSVVDMR